MKASTILTIAALALAACDNQQLVSLCPGGNDAAVPVAGAAALAKRLPAPPFHPTAHLGAHNDAVPADAPQLVTAMDVPVATSNVSLLAVPQAVAAFAGLGALQPTNGPTFAYLSTGVAGAGTPKSLEPSVTDIKPGTGFPTGQSCPGDTQGLTNDCVTLTFSFVVPAAMHTVAFDFFFLSGEYPEFVGSAYNDTFQVSLSSHSNNFTNIVFDSQNDPIDINSVLFNDPCQNLTGTGFDLLLGGTCDAGATGLLTTRAPVAPGETVSMTFQIYDATDDIYDSAVMIDNFRFEDETTTGPTTGTGTPTPTPAPACGS